MWKQQQENKHEQKQKYSCFYLALLYQIFYFFALKYEQKQQTADHNCRKNWTYILIQKMQMFTHSSFSYHYCFSVRNTVLKNLKPSFGFFNWKICISFLFLLKSRYPWGQIGANIQNFQLLGMGQFKDQTWYLLDH
jgi:hypothetical protein